MGGSLVFFISMSIRWAKAFDLQGQGNDRWYGPDFPRGHDNSAVGCNMTLTFLKAPTMKEIWPDPDLPEGPSNGGGYDPNGPC